MADLFKFRCYHCQKLMGAPPSKFGKIIHCPRCEAELVVPSPGSTETESESDDPDAFRPEALGIQLETERISPPRSSSTPSRVDTVGPDPIAFLQQVAESPEPIPANPPDSEATPDPDRPSEEGDEWPEPEIEPLVARPRGRGRVAIASGPTVSSRARDVVLPRTAMVAWSLFAILSLAFSFGSGLLIGHYLWK